MEAKAENPREVRPKAKVRARARIAATRAHATLKKKITKNMFGSSILYFNFFSKVIFDAKMSKF